MKIRRRAQAAARSPERVQLYSLIRAAQIRFLYRQLPRSFIGNMVGALILSIVLVGEQPLWLILTWFGCMTVNQVVRLVRYLQERKRDFVTPNLDRAALFWASGAFVSGALWGATAFLFFVSGHDTYQALLAILVFGAVAGAVPMIGSHMPSFYFFVLPAILPYVLRNFMEGDAAHITIGLIMSMVTLAYLSFGRSYNRLFVESLRNRFEKEMLADQLAVQNVDLEAARVEAEQANRAKSQFFAAASHDLRQPLHAMGLFASALAEKIRYPEVASIVGSITDSVHALESLFNELLDISKLDSGSIKPQLAGFDIQDVLARLRTEFTVEAEAKNIRMEISTESHIVHSDAVLLERIIRNLISNALRYTQEGSISLLLEPRGERLRIAVRDTGIGIPEEHQQRIFEEFFQVGNPGRTSKKGLGLGLSIVQRMCELLGYTMELESTAGQGSTFSFDAPTGERAPQAAATAGPPPPSPSDLSGKLIVVVDDEEAIVGGMKALLAGWGAEVIGSTNGDDVLAAVHERGRLPDLLIVDFRLGKLENGIQVAQRLREELDPEIPAILVSGSITPDLGEQARTQRFEFLLKPVLPEKLRACIFTALGKGMAGVPPPVASESR
jgi:signal transduction histidine kinase